jgi:hypothetical protein
MTNTGAFATQSGSVLTLGSFSGTAIATGTASFVRFATSGGTTLFDVTSLATSQTGSIDLVLNSLNVINGGIVQINSGGTSTEPYP